MSRFRKLHLLVLLVVCASPACEKVPLTSPTGSTISLSTNSNIVPVNGSVDITATVTESAGTAVQNGTTVNFTSDFGRMDPAEAKTQNGRATVRFMASGQSGTVKVNAYSGAASTSGGTTSGALTLLVGGAAAGRMTVRAEPPNIPQAGGTVQVFANVTDTNGNALAGAPVTFTIGGTGTGTGVLSTPTVITDANGNAQTALTTSQTTTVTAAVATATATPVTANVIVNALPAPTVVITSSTTTPAVGVAVTFSVTPTIPTGGAPIQNVTVNFGDGNTRNLGNVTGQTAVVNTFGSPGVYTVVATATDATGQTGTGSIAINIQRLLPTVSITLASTATAGSTVSGTVTAAAATGGPALQNVQVTQGGTVIYSGSGGGAFSRQLNSPGAYTFQATATDQAGTQATTAIVVVAAVAAPTITFTQTSNITPPAAINTNETFSVSATVATGLTIRSVVVVLVRTNDTLYNQSGGGTFATNNVQAGDLLRATVTDSAGNVSTFDLIVQ